MIEFSEKDIQFFVDNLEELRENPVFFAKHILNIDLHKGQRQIVSSIKDNRLVAALCPRRWGKTFAFSIAAAWMCSTNKNFRVICLAPTQRQANELFQAISNVILSSILSEYVVQNTATKLKLVNGSSVESVPGRNPDALRGLGISLLLCDEAAYISTSMFNSIYATIANVGKKTQGNLILISTPGLRTGEFYNAFQSKSRYKTFEMSYDDAIYSDGTRHMKEEELNMFADLCGGKDSKEFKREFMCEWGETDNVFFDNEGIEKSLIYNLPQIKYGIPDHIYYFGVDVGLSQDNTVIICLDATDKDNLKVVRMAKFTGKSTDEIMDILYKEAIAFKPKKVLIDDGKVGVALCSHLQIRHPNIKWEGFNFNVKSKTPIMYDLNLAMSTGILQMPDMDDIREELISYCYQENPNTGNLKLGGVGFHDDIVTAISLSLKASNIFRKKGDYIIGSNKGILTLPKNAKHPPRHSKVIHY